MVDTRGSFGFKIGKKMRLMRVDKNADILWQMGVRELYVLMKHYGTEEALKEAFVQLKDAKGKPSKECVYFNGVMEESNGWENVLKYCQLSYINVLESKYFLNNGAREGLLLVLDLNTYSLRLYEIGKDGKEREYQRATLQEIMEFEDMPTVTKDVLVADMKYRYERYQADLLYVKEEITKVDLILTKTREMGSDQNILSKAEKVREKLLWDKKKIELDYSFLYHRLKILDLLEYDE